MAVLAGMLGLMLSFPRAALFERSMVEGDATVFR
jgi:hypothetical protein